MQLDHPSIRRSLPDPPAQTPEVQAQAWFLQHLAGMQRFTRLRFRGLGSGECEEAVADVLASIFRSSLSAARSGKLHRLTPYHVVVFAVRQYRCGRRFAGYSSTDALAEATQRRGRAVVVSLAAPALSRPRRRQDDFPSLGEILSDRREQSPLERVRQSLDYPLILHRGHIDGKALRIFELLTVERGKGSVDRIAGELGVTPGRVCQLKTRLANALRAQGYEPPPQRSPSGPPQSRGRQPQKELAGAA